MKIHLLLGTILLFYSCKESKQVNTKSIVAETIDETVLEDFKEDTEDITELKRNDGFSVGITEPIQIKGAISKEEKPEFVYFVSRDAKSPHKLSNGINGRTLFFRFEEANWSHVKTTCGNDRPSDSRFTAPWPNFNQYQMMVFEEGNGERIYYPACRPKEWFSIDTKTGYEYYVYVNDTKGDHHDNHGMIHYNIATKYDISK